METNKTHPTPIDQASLFDQTPGKVRTEARQAERDAAAKAIGRLGSWRRQIFDIIAASARGLTSKEIANVLARLHPCQDCGCEHRPPIAVQLIGARLLELREWGYVTHLLDDDGSPVLRGGAEVHVLTAKGRSWKS